MFCVGKLHVHMYICIVGLLIFFDRIFVKLILQGKLHLGSISKTALKLENSRCFVNIHLLKALRTLERTAACLW